MESFVMDIATRLYDFPPYMIIILYSWQRLTLPPDDVGKRITGEQELEERVPYNSLQLVGVNKRK